MGRRQLGNEPAGHKGEKSTRKLLAAAPLIRSFPPAGSRGSVQRALERPLAAP